MVVVTGRGRESGAERIGSAIGREMVSAESATESAIRLIVSGFQNIPLSSVLEYSSSTLLQHIMVYATCAGCLKSFKTRTGFFSHLEQSKNPMCKRILQDLQEDPMFDSDTNSDNEHAGATSSVNEVDSGDSWQNPVPFEGDALGSGDDYNRSFEDFGQGCEDSSDNGDEELTRALDLEQEDGWEPERPMEGHQAAVMEDSLVQNHNEFDEEVDQEMEDLWFRSCERADETPRIVPFSACHPTSHPGSVLHHSEPNDISYRREVSSDGTNTWAPFTSEVDWKIAKWAKLRGPGSTAFSELLGIDGVSALSFALKGHLSPY